VQGVVILAWALLNYEDNKRQTSPDKALETLKQAFKRAMEYRVFSFLGKVFLERGGAVPFDNEEICVHVVAELVIWFLRVLHGHPRTGYEMLKTRKAEETQILLRVHHHTDCLEDLVDCIRAVCHRQAVLYSTQASPIWEGVVEASRAKLYRLLGQQSWYKGFVQLVDEHARSKDGKEAFLVPFVRLMTAACSGPSSQGQEGGGGGGVHSFREHVFRFMERHSGVDTKNWWDEFDRIFTVVQDPRAGVLGAEGGEVPAVVIAVLRLYRAVFTSDANRLEVLTRKTKGGGGGGRADPWWRPLLTLAQVPVHDRPWGLSLKGALLDTLAVIATPVKAGGEIRCDTAFYVWEQLSADSGTRLLHDFREAIKSTEPHQKIYSVSVGLSNLFLSILKAGGKNPKQLANIVYGLNEPEASQCARRYIELIREDVFKLVYDPHRPYDPRRPAEKWRVAATALAVFEETLNQYNLHEINSLAAVVHRAASQDTREGSETKARVKQMVGYYVMQHMLSSDMVRTLLNLIAGAREPFDRQGWLGLKHDMEHAIVEQARPPNAEEAGQSPNDGEQQQIEAIKKQLMKEGWKPAQDALKPEAEARATTPAVDAEEDVYRVGYWRELTVFRCLKLLEAAAERQESFFRLAELCDDHGVRAAGSHRSDVPGVPGMLLEDNGKLIRLAQYVQHIYNMRARPIALYVVRLIFRLTACPSRSVLARLRDTVGDDDLKMGFVQRLNSPPMEVTGIATDGDALAAEVDIIGNADGSDVEQKRQNYIRQLIIHSMLKGLDPGADVPNMTHVLLGFPTDTAHPSTWGKKQNEFQFPFDMVTPWNCMQAVLCLLVNEADSAPRLCALCYRLLRELCEDDYTSPATLSLLQRAQFLPYRFEWLVGHYMCAVAMDEHQERITFNTTAAEMLHCVAIQLHVWTQSNPIPTQYAKHLLGRLFGDDATNRDGDGGGGMGSRIPMLELFHLIISSDHPLQQPPWPIEVTQSVRLVMEKCTDPEIGDIDIRKFSTAFRAEFERGGSSDLTRQSHDIAVRWAMEFNTYMEATRKETHALHAWCQVTSARRPRSMLLWLFNAAPAHATYPPT
jgi:hypothetical protein